MYDCFLCLNDSHNPLTHKHPPPPYAVYLIECIVVLYNTACAIIVAEAVSSKGNSLDVYMKAVKMDKGAMYDIKLQINKLKKVSNMPA